jgi:hypothetical protein
MGEVEEAVRRDLEDIASRDADLARSTPAALAVCLARELDSAGNSATSKSMNAKALIDAYRLLRDIAPEKETKDSIDELAKARERRRAAAG